MANRIKKSAIDRAGADTFESQAAAFASDLNHWRDHMQRVEQDRSNAPEQPQLSSFDTPEAFVTANKAYDAQVQKLHQPYPRPVAHPTVESAIGTGADGAFVVDFEIDDDGPSLEDAFGRKKAQLFASIQSEEKLAIERIVPIGRHRYLDMRKNEISVADGFERQELASQLSAKAEELNNRHMHPEGSDGEISRLSEDIKSLQATINSPSAYLRSRRSVADNAFLDDLAEKMDAINEVRRKVAEMMNDVEDLTPDTIDAWEMRAL